MRVYIIDCDHESINIFEFTHFTLRSSHKPSFNQPPVILSLVKWRLFICVYAK